MTYYCLLVVVWIYDIAGPKLLILQLFCDNFLDISVDLFLNLFFFFFFGLSLNSCMQIIETLNTPGEKSHGHVFRANLIMFLDRAVELGSSHLICLSGSEARL